MTVGSVIRRSLRLLKAIDANDEPDAQMMADALETLNSMLNYWSATNLVWAVVSEAFTLTAGTAGYTLGPSGGFATSRPEKIVSAWIRISDIDHKLAVDVSGDAYASVVEKDYEGIPSGVWVNHAMPDLSLTFWPVPDEDYNFRLHSRKPIGSYSTLTAELNLPPGFDKLIAYNLAVELSDEYGGLGQATAALAGETMREIKRRYTPKPAVVRTTPFQPSAARMVTPAEGVTFGGQSIVFGGSSATW
jgi:hypothetical protein